MQQVYKYLTFVLLAATIVLSIGLVFSRTGNRALKRENKDLQKQIDIAQERINERTKVINGLKVKLEFWNKVITTDINENDINGLNTDIDNNIVFLSKLLHAADSLGR